MKQNFDNNTTVVYKAIFFSCKIQVLKLPDLKTYLSAEPAFQGEVWNLIAQVD